MNFYIKIILTIGVAVIGLLTSLGIGTTVYDTRDEIFPLIAKGFLVGANVLAIVVPIVQGYIDKIWSE